MKIAALSDLHGNLPRDMPHCDAVVIAGDICPGHDGNKQLAWMKSEFADWLDSLYASAVVATWGNHDFVGQLKREPKIHKKLHWVVDNGCEIDGVTFWGSPWSSPFYDWAFMEPENDLANRWAYMWDDADVVVTHSPPFGFGDLTIDGHRAGSPSLAKRLDKVKPSLAVFGHIHEGFGRLDRGYGVWANVSLLDVRYRVAHRPAVFEVSI